MASHLQVKETQPLPYSNYVETLYLLEEYQGKGIGKQLLKEIFHYFHQKIYQTIFVEILAENKTRYFYEYYGAELIKSLEITIGGKVLEELVYEWKDIEEAIEKLV
ncbi:GNAT family N-acetyltransferase [Lysinibacillus capsici]|uniref:GNAT family N-acetyltransferase n=1 Tax=Lysinibacillus TaxID=400634 RepID=UPI0034E24041